MGRNTEDALILAGFFTMLWGFFRRRKNVAAQTASGASGGASGSGAPLAGGSTYEPDGQFTGSVSLPPGFGFDFEQFNLPNGANSFFPTTQPSQPAVDPVEKDWLARTIWGEARGDGAPGMRAVAAVIMNRVASRRYPGTVRGVVTQRFQFSMWNAGEPNGAAARAVTDADRNFRTALDIAEDALTGRLSDPTGGATLYYAPAAMVPAGDVPRDWDFSKLRYTGQIGGHRFYVEL